MSPIYGARGDERSNALWGRGGRGLFTAAFAAMALAFPIAASADEGEWNNHPSTVVAEAVVEQVEQAADGERISTIVQSRTSTSSAAQSAVGSTNASWDGPGTTEGVVVDKYEFVDAINVELPAEEVVALAARPNLIITPDAPMKAAEEGPFSNTQQWPHASGNAAMWAGDAAWFAASTPTIAIVDSGIEADRADFGGRVIADLKIGDTNPGDTRGHGTFVASIAAGAADGYAGAAPTARILSLDVMDSAGAAFTSDVIRACERILELKSTHNIRVANFSLHSSWPASVRWDPLAQSVQKLWFNGVVVVSAAGNYGSWEGPSGVPFAPANDPFSIAVAAGDISDSSMGWGGIDGAPQVRSVAWWSAYGYTLDGFSKPDVAAPGRYMVAAVPADSTLVAERPENVVAPGYMQLSGTSFAAPVVAGTVAQMLARNPALTPDEVKGALMLTAQPVWAAGPGAAGVGQINASAAGDVQSPPNPNAPLNQFLVQEAAGDWVFNAEAWGYAVHDDAAWASAAWSDAAWASAAWSSAAWSDAAWASASFEDAAWSDAAWSDAAWSDAAWSDGADDDPRVDLPEMPPHGGGDPGDGGGGE